MNASGRTALLAVGLALSSLALTATTPDAPLLSDALGGLGPVPMALLLTAGFLLADLCLLHIEVRREAMSVTLAGVPLALGVLVCGPRELVLARVVGSAVAFALQRAALGKAAYNLAAYAFDAALGLALTHLLLGRQDGLGVWVALVCWTVLPAVDQLMGLLIVQVISWHQGRPSAREVAGLQLSGLLTSLLATTAAYGLVLLAEQGAVGALVLVVLLAVSTAAYRSFQVLHRRHQALAHVHDFVSLNDDEGAVVDLAGVMLEQVRDLMRAHTAELVLAGADTAVHLQVGEDGVAHPVAGRRAQDDRELDVVVRGEEAVVVPRRTRDRSHRAWLQARGVRDAVIVPLTGGGGTTGALLVFDRLGGTGSFTEEDRTLLQTLAGHLSVAVSSGWRRERLRHEATHDSLTGLGNRALLSTALADRLAERTCGAVVVMLDVDRFKEVNDTLGHHVGDALLVVIADRLTAMLPTGSTIARLGGDEFGALVPVAGLGEAGLALAAHGLGRQIAAGLDSQVVLPEATLSVQVSIGAVVALPDSSPSDLLRHADSAMYAAKTQRTGVVLYTPDLDHGRAERLALLADLHLALQRDELTVLYQPKLDLHTDVIPSVEALVRWQHPHLGWLGPDLFIPLAEANGLIAPLTAVVLGQALQQCSTWRAEGLDLAVAVNLSARTVNDPDLPEQVNAALLAAGVPASSLILEITESAVMDDPDRAVTILSRIEAIGVALSLDDFGTGYSSLAYLQRLPVREVKIDKSFVMDLTDQAHGQVLVRSIINLGKSLGLRVVAEGVEDLATLHLLQELGCDLAQGYHISRPTSAERVAALVREHTPGRARLRALGP